MARQKNLRRTHTRQGTAGQRPAVPHFRAAEDDLSRYQPANARQVAESVQAALDTPPAERIVIREATVGGTRASAPGRMLCRLIKAGWSLNNNRYGKEVLQAAARERAWPAGTACYIDHATDEEDEQRPAGSIKNLAAVLTEDARWDDAENGLVAEVRLFTPWRDTLSDMAEHIGMSIRAWVTGHHGEADGRSGFIVDRIEEGRSVDFVTVPAAGGGIISVLEAVGNRVPTAEARNAGHWFESRIHASFTELADRMFGEGYLTRDERITLSSAVGDALAAFAGRIEQDAPHLYERDPWQEPEPTGPAAADEAAAESTTTLTTPTTQDPAASAVTEHVTDGAPPASPNPPTEGEPAMSGTQTGGNSPGEAGTATTEARTATTEAPAEARLAIVEAERDRLRAREQAMSEQLAEAQADARRARAEAQEAVTEMRRLRANEAGRTTVDRMLTADEAGVPAEMQSVIGPRVHERILNHVPLADDGTVDQAALEAAVTAAIRTERVHAAQLLEAQGVGRVAGLGAEGDPTMQMNREQFEGGMADLFKSIGLDDSVAKLAAKGR